MMARAISPARRMQMVSDLNNTIGQSSSSYVNGKLVGTRDANGQLTASFGYDGSGNLTSTTNANGFRSQQHYRAILIQLCQRQACRDARCEWAIDRELRL